MKYEILGAAIIAGSIAVAAAAPIPVRADATVVDVTRLSAGELRQKPVYDANSQRVAMLEDVTGSPGPHRQAILRTGGIMGVGGREVALPLEKLDVEPDGRLVIHMTEDELRLLPEHN